ncbi:MAG: hypothetical protein J0L86_15020 [Flavobacteriales bacterium]|nr:hypothetical protein [Flavobacteriales bacterium]
MDYEVLYSYFYEKWYCKFENAIKEYLIECKNNDIKLGSAINDLKQTYIQEFADKIKLNQNDLLKELYNLFIKRFSDYEKNEINRVFENKILKNFESLNRSELPKNYTIKQLLFDFIKVDVVKEIQRLLQNNNSLLQMFYKANDFSEFEIRDHRGISIEDYPIYKKLHKRLYPEYYETAVEDSDSLNETLDIEESKLSSKQKVLLIEKLILNAEKWQSSSERKRSEILSKITGTNSDNIRKTLAMEDEKPSTYSKEFINDIKIVEKIFNQLG